MKIREHIRTSPEKIELQMTPMIDVVFQLLIFFMLSFKIGAAEGDFNVTMPAAESAGAAHQPLVTQIRVRMTAHPDGSLSSLQFGDVPLPSFQALHDEAMAIVGGADVPAAEALVDTTEVELDCDYGLHYDYVIRAIDAVSGYRAKDGRIVKLIERIKFTPPRKAEPAPP